MSLLEPLRVLGAHPVLQRLKGVWDRNERKVFYGLFGAMVLVYLLPILLSRFLPFSDLPGHLGVVGALVHADEPAAAIHKYYRLNPHFAPNSLEFYFTWMFGEIFDVVTAARIFAGLCVLAFPLSVLYALRAFGRSPWLVFLAFPLSYPRIMWYGFMGSTLGVSLLILSVAVAYRASRENTLTLPITLAGLLVLSGMSHPFFFAATLPLVMLVLLIGVPLGMRRWRNWVSFAAFLPPALVFYGWFSRMFGGALGSGGGHHTESFFQHLLAKRPAWSVYERWLSEWSLGAYRSDLEPTVLKVLGWSFALLFVWGVIYLIWRTVVTGIELRRRWRGTDAAPDGGEGEGPVAPPRGWRFRSPAGVILVVLFGCVLAAYLTLPGVIQRPVYWWAVAQRLVTPLLVFALLLLPRAVPGRLAALVVLPALVASGYYGGFLAHDFRTHWNGKEMAGLEQCLDEIPRGKRVLALYDDRETHYSHFQLHFGASYYVALRGGFAVPFPAAPAYRKIAWAYPRRRLPPGPPWGKLRYFSYARHAKHYDYFLIKRHADGRTRWNRFRRRCVEVLGQHGLWTVVRRLAKKRGC